MNLLFKKAAAILVSGIMAISAIGAESFAESAGTAYQYVDLSKEATVAKPTYQVKGTPGKRKIALSTSTAGATIYYTANGKTPTTSSRQYTGALLLIKKTTKIKAIAVKDGVASKVMTKTFYVDTKYGDVTGDGNINQNDYTKLKNFLAGKTQYICKDNADCNGDGRINAKDLTALSQYLNNRLPSLPNNPLVDVEKPTGTTSAVYGGRKVELACSTSGATIYYTTNGSTPTTASTRYTTGFTLDKTCTVQAVAYKDGEYSEIRTISVTVGDIGSIQTDKPTSVAYTTETAVTLYCGVSTARIYYTTDKSDPRTSNTRQTTMPIKLTKDTVIIAYAEAPGYANTLPVAFDYKVASAFSISGTVWDDTPGTTTIANGSRVATSEPGIGGITVYLINATTAVKDTAAYYIAKTTTDSNGRYTFTNIQKGASYKVVFEYNYQKYRAYTALVANGNQALAYTTPDVYTVKSNGTYVTSYSVDTFANSVVRYSDAIAYTGYKMYAVTTNSYTETVDNIDLALISKNYGQLNLDVSVSGQDTTKNTVKNGDKVKYLFTLTNNSPMTVNTLDAVELGIYMPILINDGFEEGNTPLTALRHGEDSRNYPGYVYWTVTFKLTGGLAPGKTATATLYGTVNSDAGTKLDCMAQVNSYRFANSCYDYYSIPGNLTYNMTRALEKDECRATTVTVTSGTSSSTQSIVAPRQQITLSKNDSKVVNALEVVVKNCKTISDVIVGKETGTGANYTYSFSPIGDDLYIYFDVTPTGDVGTVSIPIYLKSDASKYVTLTITVT